MPAIEMHRRGRTYLNDGVQTTVVHPDAGPYRKIIGDQRDQRPSVPLDGIRT